MLLHDGTEFLYVHLQTAVSDEKTHLLSRVGHLGSDGGRETESHSTQSTGSKKAPGPGVFRISGTDHLVLTDIGDDGGIAS